MENPVFSPWPSLCTGSASWTWGGGLQSASAAIVQWAVGDPVGLGQGSCGYREKMSQKNDGFEKNRWTLRGNEKAIFSNALKNLESGK